MNSLYSIHAPASLLHASPVSLPGNLMWFGKDMGMAVDRVDLGTSGTKKRLLNVDTGYCSLIAAERWLGDMFPPVVAKKLDNKRVIGIAYGLLEFMPPARNQLEAYAQLMNSIVAAENQVRGPETVIHPNKVYSAGPRTLYRLKDSSEQGVDGWLVCVSPFDLTFLGPQGETIDFRRNPPDYSFRSGNKKIEFQIPERIYASRGALTDLDSWAHWKGAELFLSHRANIELESDAPEFFSALRAYLKQSDLLPKDGFKTAGVIESDGYHHFQWTEADLKELGELMKGAPSAKNGLEAFSILHEVIYQYGSTKYQDQFLADAKDYLLWSFLYPVVENKKGYSSLSWSRESNFFSQFHNKFSLQEYLDAAYPKRYVVYNPGLPFLFMIHSNGKLEYWRKKDYPDQYYLQGHLPHSVRRKFEQDHQNIDLGEYTLVFEKAGHRSEEEREGERDSYVPYMAEGSRRYLREYITLSHTPNEAPPG